MPAEQRKGKRRAEWQHLEEIREAFCKVKESWVFPAVPEGLAIRSFTS